MAILHRQRHPGLWLPKRQPLISAETWEIDWNHPLARGMVMCIVGGTPGNMRDLARENINFPYAGTQKVLPSGMAYTGYSIPNNLTTNMDFASGSWAVGCFTHLNVVSTTSGQNPSPMARFTYTSESVNTGWQLIHAGGTTGAAQLWGMECYNNTSFGSYFTSGTSQATAGDVFLGMTSDGTTRRLMVNGKQEATTVTTPNPGTSTGTLGDFSATGSFDGNYLMVAWNRDVSAGEWAWIASEPYCYLRPLARRSRNVIVLALATGAATGSSTIVAAGQAQFPGVGAATGTSTVAAIGNQLASSLAAATGSSTVAAIGNLTASSTASATGSNTVVAVGTGAQNLIGTATGSSTVAAIGNLTAAATGAITGSTASVAAISIALTNIIGSATGTGTASAVGIAQVTAIGSATGTSTVLGTLTAKANSVGSAVGDSIANSFFDGTKPTTGSVTGTSTVTAIGNSLVASVGTASGNSDAEAASNALVAAIGHAIGNSDDPFAFGESLVEATGTATGDSLVMSISTLVVSFSVGSATGHGTANARSNAIIEITGTATGDSNATAMIFGLHTVHRPFLVILG